MAGDNDRNAPDASDLSRATGQNSNIDRVVAVSQLLENSIFFPAPSIRPGRTDFESRRLNDMVDLVENANPAELENAGTALWNARDAIKEAAEQLKGHIAQPDWEGEASEAFRKWGEGLVSDTLKLADFADAAATQITAAGAGLASVRSAMPPRDRRAVPKDVKDFPEDKRGADNPEYAAAVKAEKDRQEAINQMNRLASFYAVSGEVLSQQEGPVFKRVPNVGVPKPQGDGWRGDPGAGPVRDDVSFAQAGQTASTPNRAGVSDPGSPLPSAPGAVGVGGGGPVDPAAPVPPSVAGPAAPSAQLPPVSSPATETASVGTVPAQASPAVPSAPSVSSPTPPSIVSPLPPPVVGPVMGGANSARPIGPAGGGRPVAPVVGGAGPGRPGPVGAPGHAPASAGGSAAPVRGAQPPVGGVGAQAPAAGRPVAGGQPLGAQSPVGRAGPAVGGPASGIVGGRPGVTGAGRQPHGGRAPQGTVIGGQSPVQGHRQATGPQAAFSASSGSRPTGPTAGANRHNPAGRPESSRTNGVVGVPVQPQSGGRGNRKGFTPGGTGLVRSTDQSRAIGDDDVSEIMEVGHEGTPAEAQGRRRICPDTPTRTEGS
ncbi:hypothetical protein ACSMX9_23115 [Streptomyces sp. LE64]|uniref:hypothetical protein n=1 Tax=Streptomyces sp. LE64 TaxID=3448653 RepID=UPI0040432E19